MNERIKELSKKAVDYANVCESEAWDGAYERKFAELIVRECIEVIDNTSDNTKLMRVDPYQKIIWAIEEHFGVEE